MTIIEKFNGVIQSDNFQFFYFLFQGVAQMVESKWQ